MAAHLPSFRAIRPATHSPFPDAFPIAAAPYPRQAAQSSDSDDDLYPPFSFANQRNTRGPGPRDVGAAPPMASASAARPPMHRGGIRVDSEAQRIARIMHGCNSTQGFVRAGDGYSSDESTDSLPDLISAD